MTATAISALVAAVMAGISAPCAAVDVVTLALLVLTPRNARHVDVRVAKLCSKFCSVLWGRWSEKTEGVEHRYGGVCDD